jgi:hypothetical protein
MLTVDEIETYFNTPIKGLSHNDQVILNRINEAVAYYNENYEERSFGGTSFGFSGARAGGVVTKTVSASNPYYDSLASNIQLRLWNMIGSGDIDSAKKLINELSGSFYANILTAGAINSNLSSVYSRIIHNKDTNNRIWSQITINNNPREGDDNSPDDIKNSANGLQAGIDLFEKGNVVGGAFVQYEAGSIEQGANKADISDIEVGIYSGWFISSNTVIKGALSVGQQSFSVDRKVLDIASYKSNFNTQSIKFGAEAMQKLFGTKAADLKAFAGIGLGFVMNDTIEEKGDALSAKVEESNYVRFNGRLGVQVDNEAIPAGVDNEAVSASGLINIKWYGRLFIDALLAGSRAEYNISQNDSSIYGAEEETTSFGIAGGMSYTLSKSVSLTLDTVIKPSSQIGYNISIGASYKF